MRCHRAGATCVLCSPREFHLGEKRQDGIAAKNLPRAKESLTRAGGSDNFQGVFRFVPCGFLSRLLFCGGVGAEPWGEDTARELWEAAKLIFLTPKGDCPIVNSAGDKPMKQSQSSGCEIQRRKGRKQKFLWGICVLQRDLSS